MASMRGAVIAFLFCAACTSSPPTTDDPGDATFEAALEPDTSCPLDATYSCDISSLEGSEILCAKWTGGTAQDDMPVSCPAAGAGWSVGASSDEGAACIYTWTKTGTPPDPCQLPTYQDAGAFLWLTASCEAGCP